MSDKLKGITRYNIDADINVNGEAYHLRDRNNHSGEYVLYSDIEELLQTSKHEIINKILWREVADYFMYTDDKMNPNGSEKEQKARWELYKLDIIAMADGYEETI